MTIYQVLPRLWGKGKLSEWDSEAFDYLKTLGVTHIWLTGIPRHATGAHFVKGDPGSPYSISDWYDVNPYLADKPARRLDEFDSLVKRAHKSGLKVIIDYIPNHVAKDYQGPLKLKGYCDYDWTDTLKVDYNDRESWEEMLRILRFWASRGVDGFRCDMVELVPRDFLGWLVGSMKAEFPDVIFIAEAYCKQDYRDFIENVGFDLLYDKSGEYDALRSIMQGGDVAQLNWNWQFLGDMQPRMLNFLENHDEERLPRPHFAALAAASAFNRASYMIYFGEEIGENAASSDNARTSIFNWENIASIQRLVRYIHGENSLEPDELKTLEKYREILRLSTLARDWSNYDLSWCNPGRSFSFLRYNGERCLLFVCNFSSETLNTAVLIPEDARALAGVEPSELALSVEPRDCTVVEVPIENRKNLG